MRLIMDIGATLTTREARTILRRLNTITRLTDDRRIKEQARMIGCDVNKAASMRHHFCSRDCAKTFTGPRMRDMNERLNPGRMTPETKAKLREAHLDSGAGKTYTKTYGRHTHRIVAEQILGRPLLPGEVVHHIDGDKRNNDPSNLMVFASQEEHARYHMMQRSHGI